MNPRKQNAAILGAGAAACAVCCAGPILGFTTLGIGAIGFALCDRDDAAQHTQAQATQNTKTRAHFFASGSTTSSTRRSAGRNSSATDCTSLGLIDV